MEELLSEEIRNKSRLRGTIKTRRFFSFFFSKKEKLVQTKKT